jgi:hypothetical protein
MKPVSWNSSTHYQLSFMCGPANEIMQRKWGQKVSGHLVDIFFQIILCPLPSTVSQEDSEDTLENWGIEESQHEGHSPSRTSKLMCGLHVKKKSIFTGLGY